MADMEERKVKKRTEDWPECPECGRPFKTYASMLQHRRSAHGYNPEEKLGGFGLDMPELSEPEGDGGGVQETRQGTFFESYEEDGND